MSRKPQCFAKFDIAFLLGDRHGFPQNYTANQRLVYMMLWALAVRERTETLTGVLTQPHVLAKLFHIGTRVVTRALQKCRQTGLIRWHKGRHLTVCGVRSKHAGLRNWAGSEPPPKRALKGGGEGEERESTPLTPPRGASPASLPGQPEDWRALKRALAAGEITAGVLHDVRWKAQLSTHRDYRGQVHLATGSGHERYATRANWQTYTWE